jgi:hypothetical protein
MTTQMRIVTVKPGQLETFTQLWLATVYPLRLKYDFRIDGAWSVPTESRFVWLLTYIGPESFEERDAAYYASADRAALDPDPGQYIEHVEAFIVTSVLPYT